jgi:hypothetical protein
MPPLGRSSTEVNPNSYEFSVEQSLIKINEGETQTKEKKFLFGCLDICTIWSPSSTSHSGPSCNLDEYLTLQPSAENQTDSHRELSFSYSSFSEEDCEKEEEMRAKTRTPEEDLFDIRSNGSLLTVESEQECDEVSAGSDSSLSFDSDEFLEDEIMGVENSVQPRLEMIAESFEQYQARSQ